MAQFRVRTRSDLSLADVAHLQAAGGAVMRSAHVGNWSPGNLNVAALGIRCVLTDLTLTGADTIYHPSGVIVGRRFYPGLCSRGRSLVVRKPVHRTALPQGLEEWFPAGKNLAEAHLDALRKAIPATDVTLFSEYATRHIDVVLPILEMSADHMPHLWRRRNLAHLGVQDAQYSAPGESDTNRSRRLAAQPTCWRDVSAGGVFGITNPEQGWLVPKAVMCLAMAVADAHHYGTDEVYHLAGVRMMNYIGDLRPELQHLFEVVAGRLGLPEQLTFHLVPSANMTLGAPESERVSLDRLVDTYLTARSGQSGSPARRDAAAAPGGAEAFRARTLLAWTAASCPIPFFDVRDADYCTQYDLLVARTGWYVHPWGLRAPLREVGRMIETTSRLRGEQEGPRRRLISNIGGGS